MQSTWNIQNNAGRLSTDALGGVVDLNQPGDGLSEISAFGHTIAGCQLFGLYHDITQPRPISGPVVDRFVRQDDLFVRYGQTDQQRFSPSVYYHAQLLAEQAVGIRLIASIQTDLLDTHPDLVTQTICPGGEIQKLVDANEPRWNLIQDGEADFTEHEAPHCLLIRPANSKLSFAEMIHPADFRGASLRRESHGDATHIKLQSLLLDRWMEKGVILRARAQALFVPREHDEQTVFAAYQRFVDAALPLTV